MECTNNRIVPKRQKAEYGECPSCRYIGKMTETTGYETPQRLTALQFLIGSVATALGMMSGEAVLALPGILWLIYCLAVRKIPVHYSVCTRCGYEYIIPLSEEECKSRSAEIAPCEKED